MLGDSQLRGEQTRGRILDAALEAFATHGYDATGVAEVCRRAGVTKGAFYYHFAGKQQLFLQMLTRWLQQTDLQLEAFGSSPGRAPQKLVAMTALLDQVFQQAGDKLPIFLEFLAAAAHTQAVQEVTVVPFRRYEGLLADAVSAGMAEGSLRTVDTHMAGHLLLAFAIGVLASALLDPQGADWGDVAREGMEILLSGLMSPDEHLRLSQPSP